MTRSAISLPVCPTEELLGVCAQARKLAEPVHNSSAACARLTYLSSMDQRDHGGGKGEDTCASTKVWLACNPQHVLKNTVESTIPPLLYACDTNQLSQSAGSISTSSPTKCRFVSPMPEAQFARKQQQRAYALTEELKALMEQCHSESSDANAGRPPREDVSKGEDALKATTASKTPRADLARFGKLSDAI